MGRDGSLAEALSDVLDGAYEASTERAQADDAARRRMIGKLFALFAERDMRRAELYVELTEHIPRRTLACALRSVVESHVWRSLPTIAEIVQAAKVVAGMHREQYHAGRYLPAPREWPPEGLRHGIMVGTFEPAEVRRDLRPALPEVQERLALPEVCE